eukprot:750588-Hanusia_phi.AAC.2
MSRRIPVVIIVEEGKLLIVLFLIAHIVLVLVLVLVLLVLLLISLILLFVLVLVLIKVSVTFVTIAQSSISFHHKPNLSLRCYQPRCITFLIELFSKRACSAAGT